MALFTGGLAQLLAGMWEFPRGNTFGATGELSYTFLCRHGYIPLVVWPLSTIFTFLFNASRLTPAALLESTQPYV